MSGKKGGVLALMALSLSLILGCGPEATEESTAKKLTIWWAQWDPAAGLQDLSAEFTQQTGIEVEVHQIPWPSYQDQVFLNFGNSKTDFDIVIGDSQWLGRGATKGLYLELTDWLPKAVNLESVHPLALRYLCEFPAGSKKYFAAPCETDALGFMYRRDWFEDALERTAFEQKFGRPLQVPDTWEEFRDVAAFFHRPDEKRYGCSLLTGRGYDSITMGFQVFLWSWGGSWGDENTYAVEGHANSPEAVSALEFMKDLLAFTPPGGTSSDYFANLDAFQNGSTAMVLDYFPFYPGAVAAMGEQVGFFKVPARGDNRFVSLGGQGFSISAKTPPAQQELAKQFIRWFLQDEIQQKWVQYPGCFTANTALLSSAEFRQASPYNGVFAESLDYVKDFWNVPVYNELLAVTQRSLGEAVDGVKTPQKALDELAQAKEDIFRQADLLKD